MANINFPNSPSIGNTYTSDYGVTYEWNGESWEVVGAGAEDSTITITAGAGLANGGSFTLNQAANTQIFLNVGAGNGVTVNADDVAVNAQDGLVANTSGLFVLAGNSQVVSNSSGVFINESQINHDSLSGFVSNEHVDHSIINVIAGTGLTGGGAITANVTLNVGGGNGITVAADTISADGANGISVTAAGINVLAGNTQLISNTTGLWIIQSNIDHDSLSGFVSNEHVDHTSVTLTAGAGLTGGGDISTNRTFTVGAGNGVTVNADDVAVNAQDGLVANSSGLFVQAGDNIVVNSSGVHATGGAGANGTTVLHGNGAQTAPSMSFSNSTATGFYLLATNEMGLSIGGVQHGYFGSDFIQYITNTTEFLADEFATPIVQLYANTLAGTADIGRIRFFALDSTNAKTQYASIVGRTTDATNGTEDGQLYIRTAVNGVTSNIAFFDANGMSVGTGRRVLTPNGSVSSPSYGFIDDPNSGVYSIGANRVGVSADGTLVFEVSNVNKVYAYNADVQVNSTDAAGYGYQYYWQGNTATTNIGYTQWIAHDSLNNQTVYAQIDSTIVDNTNGSEDGDLNFSVMSAGTLTEKLTLSANGLTLAGDYTIQDVNPTIKFIETGVTANNSQWWLLADAEIFSLSARNDAGAGSGQDIRFERTDNVLDSMAFYKAGSPWFLVDVTNSKVGIGNNTPGQMLTVAGTIESTTGGVKFPDGTTQTSAGASTGKAIAMAMIFG